MPAIRISEKEQLGLFLSDTTRSPERFFDMLPDDWRESIAPCWHRYATGSRIVLLMLGDEVFGGGIIFDRPAPDTLIYEEEAQSWFDSGHLYLGFIWICEQHRGKNLGSEWIQRVRETDPGQAYWLAIEDIGLAAFYKKNGFELKKTLTVSGNQEWIMTCAALSDQKKA